MDKARPEELADDVTTAAKNKLAQARLTELVAALEAENGPVSADQIQAVLDIIRRAHDEQGITVQGPTATPAEPLGDQRLPE
ncbi:hypothetical protein KIK06_15955 [Nocardiopsis sp. EMB25]|uniref:hypothetical protein n=1 Tax=Nocardiopsis sp. EMB25 TaxID=2835867 RepID=UPI002283DDBC|nr:hypothetical protein [Nocardiopsis sp. EMB25]MCY9785379.1 hypothetical protein [Nocardiopsis sp. EMB25]